MSGTPAGAKKAVLTNKSRYGDDFYKVQGSIGGKHGTGHKFAHGKVSPSEAGRLGGTISRRKPKRNQGGGWVNPSSNALH